MAEKSGQPEAMYCLGCYYRLDFLESRECPECGRKFDPYRPETFSISPKRFSMPRWELGVALLLFLIFFIQTRSWMSIRYRHARVSWVHMYGWLLNRFNEVIWSAPFVCLIPVFILSAFRADRKNRVNVGLCLVMLLAFIAYPQTREWFTGVAYVVSEIHHADHMLDSRSGQ